MSAHAQQVLEDRFEILEPIGEGGFAHVYAARARATGRKVALKVLKDSFLADTEVVERFRREVFAVASINSPFVVALQDFGISDDVFYLAMEYVEGLSLRDLIGQVTWTVDDIYVIVGQIAAALAAAHAQNIVHRDLKPENVMLIHGNLGRQVKVLDFGLAKLAELERNLGLAPLTQVGMCFGTPQYMSPEVIFGKPVDASADLFALSVIAYELLAGRRPWDAPNPAEVMQAVVKQPVPEIGHLGVAPGRRDQVNAFFRRALARAKANRPPDAASFFSELEAALCGEPRPSAAGAQPGSSSDVFRAVVRPIGISPGLGGGTDETTRVDTAAVPADLTVPMALQSEGADPSRRSAPRLRAAWLESIPNLVASGAAGGEAADPDGAAPRVLLDEGLATEPNLAAHRHRSGPYRARPAAGGWGPWRMLALGAGVVLLMVAAALVGYLVGRG